jgi:dUTP pyrophosphatase
METLIVQYLDDTIEKLQVKENSDWIDLRVAKDYLIKAGQHELIDLGVAIKLPEGYEAYIVPRSSTFKNYGVLQPNSPGIVDNSYCGPNDWWRMSVYATRDTVIKKGERICQFRINKKQPQITFVEGKMTDPDRSGFGSTGKM